MSELLVFTALLPFAALPLFGKREQHVLMWLSPLIALGWVSYFLWLRSTEPLIWIPVVAFFCLYTSEIAESKTLRPLVTLGGLFYAQALLAQGTAEVVICLAFGDAAMSAENFLAAPNSKRERVIQSIYRSAASLIPVVLGVLLGLPENLLVWTIAVTIVLRATSWPIQHWLDNEEEVSKRVQFILVGAVSAVALLHSFSLPPYWALVWLTAAAVMSLGARYYESLALLSLGLFAVSPSYGLLTVALWPVYLHQGRAAVILFLCLLVEGTVICNFTSNTVILENANYFVGALAGLILSRSLVSVKILKRHWSREVLDIFLMALVGAAVVFFANPAIPEIGIPGVSFAPALILGLIVGKILYKKRPKFFSELPPIPETEPSAESSLTWTEKPGRGTAISSFWLEKVFMRIFESESHLIWLLGFLGVVLLWGVR